MFVMPRAPSKCLNIGCSKAATNAGRCQVHYVPWSQPSPRNMTRPSNAATLMRKVRQRDRECCYVCGGPGRIVDHIIPVAEGGSWDLANLMCICDHCHTTKTRTEAARGRARHL